jgi:transcriptional regulator with XRE-family HTH domain
VPETGSPTARRRELGTQLRALRKEKGWTAQYVADRLEISASKVSRLETGQRGVRAQDIRALCDLYQVPGDRRQQLTELAAEGKERAWWQPFDLPYSTYVGLEADATSIRDFALGIIPGLLQTADYATAAVRAAEPHQPDEVVRQRVDARLARQQRILGAGSPSFSAILDEAVLHRAVGSPLIMREQLDRLLKASYLPSVSIRVVPFRAGALPAGNNKFIILGFDRPAIADVVYVESLSGELVLDHESDLKVYNNAYETLSGMAASAEQTRDLIASFRHDYE